MCIAVEIVNLDLDLWTVDFLRGLPLYPTPTSLSPDTEQGGPTVTKLAVCGCPQHSDPVPIAQ